MPANLPFIPDTITVHLGAPNDTNAPNVTLPFIDYIKNVASSEIYPTWPENALRANIYAQISFALNRIYTEYYRSRGYPFDITSSTAYDQYFVNGRDIFENIDRIVSEIFDSYLRRPGSIEPLFAQYCDGINVTCPGGLSQWGSVTLANQNLTPYEILQNYYGENLEIVTNVPVGSPQASVPPVPLRLGSSGNDVRTAQIRLNRISDNFPSIPKIVATDGIFLEDTQDAVRQFQTVFNLDPDGVIGRATWYAIERIYSSVKRLNELNSEGITLQEVTKQYPDVLRLGSTGIGVSNLQYFIDYLSAFYDTIPSVAIDGVFGASTEQAVKDVQRTLGLEVDGVVAELTWNAIYNAYLGIIQGIPIQYTEGNILPYPGYLLRLGSESEVVRVLQEYLNYIARSFPEVPEVNPTGYFGNRTQEAVIAVQNLVNLPANGVVGALTWNAITDLYSDLYNGRRVNEGQYPGYELGNT
jgi:peptidoglycan hydrolase-like protein with peptidoglycan-binding domain